LVEDKYGDILSPQGKGFEPGDKERVLEPKLRTPRREITQDYHQWDPPGEGEKTGSPIAQPPAEGGKIFLEEGFDDRHREEKKEDQSDREVIEAGGEKTETSSLGIAANKSLVKIRGANQKIEQGDGENGKNNDSPPAPDGESRLLGTVDESSLHRLFAALPSSFPTGRRGSI
jgi:hypothetical protein